MSLKRWWKKLDPEIKKILIEKGITYSVIASAGAGVIMLTVMFLSKINPGMALKEFLENSSTMTGNLLEQWKKKWEDTQRDIL